MCFASFALLLFSQIIQVLLQSINYASLLLILSFYLLEESGVERESIGEPV